MADSVLGLREALQALIDAVNRVHVSSYEAGPLDSAIFAAEAALAAHDAKGICPVCERHDDGVTAMRKGLLDAKGHIYKHMTTRDPSDLKAALDAIHGGLLDGC